MNFIYDSPGLLLRLKYRYIVQASKFLITRFKVGDIAYILKDAQHGKLKKVAIRHVRVRSIGNSYVGVYDQAYYVDSYHATWEEDMLVCHGDAVNWAIAYWQAVAADIANQP